MLMRHCDVAVGPCRVLHPGPAASRSPSSPHPYRSSTDPAQHDTAPGGSYVERPSEAQAKTPPPIPPYECRPPALRPSPTEPGRASHFADPRAQERDALPLPPFRPAPPPCSTSRGACPHARHVDTGNGGVELGEEEAGPRRTRQGISSNGGVAFKGHAVAAGLELIYMRLAGRALHPPIRRTSRCMRRQSALDRCTGGRVRASNGEATAGAGRPPPGHLPPGRGRCWCWLPRRHHGRDHQRRRRHGGRARHAVRGGRRRRRQARLLQRVQRVLAHAGGVGAGAEGQGGGGVPPGGRPRAQPRADLGLQRRRGHAAAGGAGRLRRGHVPGHHLSLARPLTDVQTQAW